MAGYQDPWRDDGSSRLDYFDWDDGFLPATFGNLIPVVGNALHTIGGTVFDAFTQPTGGDDLHTSLFDTGEYEFNFSPWDAVESQLDYALNDGPVPGSSDDFIGQQKEDHGPTIISQETGNILSGVVDKDTTYRGWDEDENEFTQLDMPKYLHGLSPGDALYDAFMQDANLVTQNKKDKYDKKEERDYQNKLDTWKQKQQALIELGKNLSNYKTEAFQYDKLGE